MDINEVKKLASLARLELGQEELEKMSIEIGHILEYVDQIKGAVSDIKDLQFENTGARNVMREDEDLNNAGLNTDKILSSAPLVENQQIKVKKIL